MNNNTFCRIGVDVGSTTVKIILIDSLGDVIYKKYLRHKTDFNSILIQELRYILNLMPDAKFSIRITGSAGIGISERTGISFIQEVVSSIEVLKKKYEGTRTMIDIGGEDSKLIVFEEGRKPDIRMNGSCAGGTGAFIDQMADLMNISIDQMNEQALGYSKLYPVASRCGVFAKTDVQNMIARNLPAPDISMSVLQAVAVQFLASLAKGTDLLLPMVCVGGPLTFNSALRRAFCDVLQISENDMIVPENSEFFPAWGAAIYEIEDEFTQDIEEVINKLSIKCKSVAENLPVLFENEESYGEWLGSRNIKSLKFRELKEGDDIDCYLGIDSGSTTTKIVIIDDDTNIIYKFYSSNEGAPLKKAIEGLNRFYEEAKSKNVKFRFRSSASTGYGEDLLKSALNIDFGIVETIAHFSGAQYVDPNVSFVLDIGGQDMKSIFIKNGIISNIELNESCSSGCGSFLQNFASTMNISLEDFAHSACLARKPQDLGTRCTVFMNSKVKESLRQNATLGDIASGLSYSVVKNCLFKVLKISNLNHLGNSIVVQGGTFKNDAVYRALELLSEKKISSTDFPELMGALGSALYAKKSWSKKQHSTSFTGAEDLALIRSSMKKKELQCRGCMNQCSIISFEFTNGNICHVGNKCEKIFYNKANAPKKGYNAFEMKYDLLFNRDGDNGSSSPKIRIGIPRALNMYENFPFWNKLFVETGFEVVLSDESTFSLYQKGVGSIMSDNICFPAKLAHGHIISLANKNVDRIFYPIVQKEAKEFRSTTDSFNCPIVSGYPDVISSSIDPKERYNIRFDKPVISMHNDKALLIGSWKYFSRLGVSRDKFKKAFRLAKVERDLFVSTLRGNQRELLDNALESGEMLFVVSGRPYHSDPLIHQKVAQILSDLGVIVLTDDVFRVPESDDFKKLNIISQWSYPNRTVQVALEVAKLPENIQYVQLNSFGCGPDSFFMDEISHILQAQGKNNTVIRIDEIASSGSIRLRLRSLIESLKITTPRCKAEIGSYNGYNRGYRKEDINKTILVPWLADFISPFIPALGKLIGYNLVNLPKPDKTSIDLGLKYGQNEVCYPSTLVLGDIISALRSGNYDLENIVVAITQTGGQCRATNYLSQIKNGLLEAGFRDIPVVVISSNGKALQNDQEAFELPLLRVTNITVDVILYADIVQQMYGAVVIKEKEKGKSRELFDRYIGLGVEAVYGNSSKELFRLLALAVIDFNNIEIHEGEYNKVGLVGEIYVKYNDFGQSYISDWIRSNGVEVVTTPLLDFFMQYFVNYKINIKNNLNKSSIFQSFLNPLMLGYLRRKTAKFESIYKDFRFYKPSISIFEKSKYASEILDLSNQYGEGWLIAAEIANYAREGINQVVCVQPFGCIANQVVARGVERKIRKIYPKMNLLFIDIDSSIADVNIQNRLHFLIK